jgi:transposase
MRLKISESKNSKSFYITKTIYENGKERTITVEKLGTEKELKEKLNGKDPIKWGRERALELTRQEKEHTREIMLKYSPVKTIEKGERRSFNGGYLFLQKIYHELGINKLCKEISKRHKFEFNLDSILSRLVYGRLIFPASKLATNELSKKFIEQPDFKLHNIYRALEVVATESDFIQAELYNNSLNMSKRNTGVLFYDCTNFFFETEQEEGMKQYEFSKENKPSPIVQMGLFMDGDGIPLAFSMTDGNTNEQVTLRPLEEKILSDFKLSKFVVCTDAGLSSTDNRKFNTKGERAFITTQSVKKLKKHLKHWALEPTNWHLSGSFKTYDISKLDDEEYLDEFTGNINQVKERTFFKERWIKEDDLEQKLIVTYSLKYRDYQRKIRANQIERATKLIAESPQKLKKANSNDCKRFIKNISYTPDGEVAAKESFNIDNELIAKEESFDGFYGVCTNLEDEPADIAKISHRRWEIEECFKIMKSEFKARPVFLKRDDRIKAHFMTCFITLIIYRFLEKRLGDKFTCYEIIDGLREMDFLKASGEGYIPAYTRTDFTDALHEAFEFRTDYEIVTNKQMKNIFQITKK